MSNNDFKFVLQAGEGQFVEFKEFFDKSISKEIVAFANASGGRIYMGITDTGLIKGISVTNKLKSEMQDIARNCDPSILVLLEEIDDVLIVEIKEGVNKPYSCSTGFFMRMGANSQKMNRDEILGLAIKSGRIRFDEQVCSNFEWIDFDEEKFKYYLKLAKISYNLERDEILRKIRILTNDGFTNAGVLFFAKEPNKYIISSKIRCVHFKDNNRIEILDKKVVDRGLIGNIEFAVEYLMERVPVKYEIKKLARDEFPEYPIDAYREAIVNSIVHFDYYLGDTVAIEKQKKRIVINNKGELLFPEEEFGKKSESRNRLLADLLSRTEYMEKAGTGIKRIRDACEQNGNKVIFSFSDSFWVEIESNNQADVPENVTGNVTGNVTDRQNTILLMIAENKFISVREIAEKLNFSKRTILREIDDMKTMGLLKRIGKGKGGHWEIIK